MSDIGKISASKKILYCVLNWGLGHATRSIPIINHLEKDGYEVIIASSGRSKSLLEKEYIDKKIIDLPDYNITYAKHPLLFPIKMAFQIPSLLKNIKKEQTLIEQFCKTYEIDLIISDNKFGCYAKSIPSIFITHQISIKAPLKWLESFIFNINHKFIKNYNECWIPDIDQNPNLSGQLSKGKINIPKIFIGGLSRFKSADLDKKYKYCAIVSGPEPQRTFFQEELIDLLAKTNEPSIIICGKPETNNNKRIEKLEIKDAAFGDELEQIIHQSEIIISRAGYSSIMDYAATKSNAILIPTPGQTEQEYLGQYLSSHNQFTYLDKLNFEQIKKATFNKVAFLESKTNFDLISKRVARLVS